MPKMDILAEALTRASAPYEVLQSGRVKWSDGSYSPNEAAALARLAEIEQAHADKLAEEIAERERAHAANAQITRGMKRASKDAAANAKRIWDASLGIGESPYQRAERERAAIKERLGF